MGTSGWLGPAPRWATARTPSRPTYGPACSEIATKLGTPPMPWQRLVLDVALEVLPNGDWAFDTVVVTVQRQAGKTTIVRPVIVHRCSSAERRRVFITAQTRKHARRRWMDATDSLLSARLLKGKLKRKVSNGFEELRWTAGGSTFEPFAPNEGDMHGESPDLALVDELWALDSLTYEGLQGAVEPGFLTKNAQIWLFSTMGTAASEPLNDQVELGRAAVEAGVNTGTAYFEWSLPDEIDGVPVEDLDDEALLAAVLAYHPAHCPFPDCDGPAADKPCPHGFTLRPAAVKAALRKAKSRAAFLRPYGNRATLVDFDRIFPEPVLVAASTLDQIPDDVMPGLGIDVDPDRREASISAAWRDPETGVGLLEVIRCELGTRWTASAVVGICERQGIHQVAVNNAGPARDIADEIERAGVDDKGVRWLHVLRLSAMDYSAACARVYDGMHAARPEVRHNGSEALLTALGQLGWRRLGNSRAFDVVDEPVTAATSATLALWAADHPPEIERPLPRSQVF